jgi:hypothetical protein
MPGHIHNPNEWADDTLFALPKFDLTRCTVVTGRTENSREAAARALPRSGTQRRRIYELVKQSRGGLTADDVQRITNLPTNSVNPRVHELVKDGWLVDSGTKRDTRWGAPATVWVAA